MASNTTSKSKQFYVFQPDKEVTLSNDWFKDYPINTLFYNPRYIPVWSIATKDERNFLVSRSITDEYVPEEIRAKALLLKD